VLVVPWSIAAIKSLIYSSTMKLKLIIQLNFMWNLNGIVALDVT